MILSKLNELQAIKEAKPSEALKTLEILDNTISPLLEPILAEYEDDLSDKITANYFVLKQALLKAQEQEKVLNSIIEHLSFKDSGTEEYIDFRTNQKVKKYMFEIESKDTGVTIHIHLDTQEEFELLKRYCEWIIKK